MQKQKCSLKLYSNFLIANHNRFSGSELAKTAESMAHDSVSRWLSDAHFTPSELWGDVKRLVDVSRGYLIGDDSVLSISNTRAAMN